MFRVFLNRLYNFKEKEIRQCFITKRRFLDLLFLFIKKSPPHWKKSF